MNTPYMPHGTCVNWNAAILIRTVLGNLLTAMAYFSIPFSLIIIYKNNPGISWRIRAALLLFVVFILMCGLGHTLDIITIWYPVYYWESMWKLSTGVISTVVAALLFPEITAYIQRSRRA